MAEPVLRQAGQCSHCGGPGGPDLCEGCFLDETVIVAGLASLENRDGHVSDDDIEFHAALAAQLDVFAYCFACGEGWEHHCRCLGGNS